MFPIEKGGRTRVIDLHLINFVFSRKLPRNMVNDSTNLLAKTLRNKYYYNSVIFSIQKDKCSWGLKSVMGGFKSIKEGFFWILGDWCDIFFWVYNYNLLSLASNPYRKRKHNVKLANFRPKTSFTNPWYH